MLSEQTKQEPFEAVLARVRSKARSEEPVPVRATGQGSQAVMNADTAEAEARAQARAAFQESIRPDDSEWIDDPRSAAATRIGWYIPKRHRGDTLENFVPRNASQRVALQAVRGWVDAAERDEGPALVLTGGVGTGKSMLMYAAVRELNLRGVHAGAWGWLDLALTLKDAKFGGGDAQSRAREQRDRLFAARAIAIDEIRPTSGTDFDATELSQIMTRAYREQQAMICTSNYADAGLTQILGLAATSRLTQVQLVGADYRSRHLRAV